MGMKVCCVSLVTNMAAGISLTPLTHEEVKIAGKEAAEKFSALLSRSLTVMEEYLKKTE